MKEDNLLMQIEEQVTEKVTIYQKIEQKGQNDALAILEAGREKAEQMYASMINEAMQDNQKRLEKARQANASMLKGAQSQFDHSLKQYTLSVKKELIDRVFKRLLEKFKAFSDEDIRRYVVERIKNENLSGTETLKVAPSDYDRYARIFSSGRTLNGMVLLDKLSNLLGNFNYQLTLAKDGANISGGFQVIGSFYDLDFSYDALFDDLKRLYETELATILFDGDE